MKRHLPGKLEMAIFASGAVVAASLVASNESRDLGMAALAAPIFLTAAVTGMVKSGRYAPDGSVADRDTRQTASDDH